MIDAPPPVVLRVFPSDPTAFADDLQPFAASILARHGAEEWRAAILTHECHGHLGVFSMLGAKMAVRAREMLNAPRHALNVLSHAGSTPPLSCMNDGLQVASGATLGRGTIRVAEGEPRAAADFIRDGDRVTLRVREAVLAQVRAAMGEVRDRVPCGAPGHDAEMRRVAIGFWLELDRAAVFEETIDRCSDVAPLSNS